MISGISLREFLDQEIAFERGLIYEDYVADRLNRQQMLQDFLAEDWSEDF